MRCGDELHELNHGSAISLRPLRPGVRSEDSAGDGEEAVKVEVESFVDGLVPVEEGLVLEALLDGKVRLGVGGFGGGEWRRVFLLAGERFGVFGIGFLFDGRMLVGKHFGTVGVGGAGFAGGFFAGHC